MKGLLQWRVFEEHCNSLLRLEATPASGARWHDPGDGVDHRHYSATDYALLIDAKFTEAGSKTVNLKEMRTWLDRAREAGKRFAMPVRFLDKNGETEDFIVVPLNDFAELLDRLREKEER